MTRLLLAVMLLAAAPLTLSACASTNVPCGCVKPELQMPPEEDENDPAKKSATPEQDAELEKQG